AKGLTIKCECQDPLQIAEEAFNAFRPTAEMRGFHLWSILRAETKQVYVDRDRILQALNNYLDNALKFGAAGSDIVLRVEPDSAGNGIQFSVVDHGPGLTAD